MKRSPAGWRARALVTGSEPSVTALRSHAAPRHCVGQLVFSGRSRAANERFVPETGLVIQLPRSEFAMGRICPHRDERRDEPADDLARSPGYSRRRPEIGITRASTSKPLESADDSSAGQGAAVGHTRRRWSLSGGCLSHGARYGAHWTRTRRDRPQESDDAGARSRTAFGSAGRFAGTARDGARSARRPSPCPCPRSRRAWRDHAGHCVA